MLDVRGLRIASRWFSSFLISKPLEENVKAFEAELAFLAAVGAKAINVSEQSYSVQGMEKTPIFGHKYVMNEQEWGLLTNGLNTLGKIATEKGFRLCFHHHMGTVVQTAEETTRMLDETDANTSISATTPATLSLRAPTRSPCSRSMSTAWGTFISRTSACRCSSACTRRT